MSGVKDISSSGKRRQRNPIQRLGDPVTTNYTRGKNTSLQNTTDNQIGLQILPLDSSAQGTSNALMFPINNLRPRSNSGGSKSIAISNRSIHSQNAHKKAQVDLEAQQKTAELQKEAIKWKRILDGLREQILSDREVVRLLELEINQCDTTGEDKEPRIAQKNAVEKKLKNIQIDFEFAEDQFNEINAKLAEIPLKSVVLKSKIDADEDEELDRRSHEERMADVDNWAESSQNQGKGDSEDDLFGNQPQGQNAIEDGQDVIMLQNIPQNQYPPNQQSKVPQGPNPTGKAKIPVPIIYKTTDPSFQQFEAIAQAFANVFKPMGSVPSNSSSEKLLARQIHGRDLPVFSGIADEWATFISTYESSTRNCEFSNAENLVRLQRCLKEEARQTVQSLLVTEDNVPTIIDKLRSWYGNPEIIISSMIAKVKAFSQIKNDRPEALVDLGRTVDNLVATVTALNQSEQLSSPLLVKEIADKLPRDLQMQWSLHVTKSGIVFPKLNDFSTWFNPYIQAARRLCTGNETTHVKVDTRPTNKGRHRPNERAMVTTERYKSQMSHKPYNTRESYRPKCIACESTDHRSYQCPVFNKKKVDERWDIVKQAKVCSGCLGSCHQQKECKTKRKCGIKGCDREHNRLLHYDKAQKDKSQEQTKTLQEVASSPETEQCKLAGAGKQINYLVVPAKARNSKGELVPIYIALDSLSSFTAINADTAKYLGIKGVHKPFQVDAFQSTTTINNSYLVDIEIHSKVEDFSFTLKNVRTIPKLALPSQSVSMDIIKKFKHLQDVPIEAFNLLTPTILLGMDNYELHYHRQIKEGNPGEPAAIKTALGWAVVGHLSKSRQIHHVFKMTEVCDDPLHQLVQQYFTTEAIGVEPEKQRPRSREDVRAQTIMDDTIRRVENGWESGLLWREDNVRLPKSKDYALKRLYSMERKMDKDPVFAAQYMEHVQTFMQKGFAKILSKEEAAYDDNKTFYLPHFMAFNEKKSNKYRFVFDAAAKVGGQSLNSHLLQGPDKLKSLVGILLQFRQRKVAITADIKDFFPRVKVRKEDVNAQRFLWRGMDRDRPPDVCRMESLIFGAACSPALAQEAKERNAREFQEEFPKAYRAIIHKHYVDDYLDSVDSEEEAIILQKQVTNIQNKGSFQLCNWLSNSQTVLDSIPENLHAKSLKSLTGKEDLVERVLGLFWRPEQDDFTFKMKYLKAKEETITGERVPTKREVLSLVMSLFDPIGFLAILTVKAKMILQATWRSKIGWDDPIPHSAYTRWQEWLTELQQIQSFSIPRCYSQNFSTSEDVQLHIFGDGSEEAFGAVAYFRIAKYGKVDTSFVMAKTNVAPLKPLSIPRLELQAALMAARMFKFIQENIEIKISRIVFWTDSTTVLSWIRGDGLRYKQFVATRIGKIQTITDVIQWKWVPTAHNVADELTRFAKPCDWSLNSRWLNGPSFLKEEEDMWPKEKQYHTKPDVDAELKKETVFTVQETQEIIQANNISKWRKLVRTLAYVFRFSRLARRQPTPSGGITISEEINSETQLLIQMQKDSFAGEIKLISQGKPLPKSSKLYKLSPALLNGLLIVKGRLDNAFEIQPQTRRPIIVDPKHPYMRLLVNNYHNKCGHHGQERIANELRQSYYVLSLRTAVRSAQNRCQVCKNKRAIPTPPEMGQLPKFRLKEQIRPFIVTGLDYFGPIEIIVKRSREKRYCALFTCLSTRAIHLELAGALTTDSCIMAIRRFIARRGCPSSIYSDNGTNFTGANSELKKSLQDMDQDKLDGFCQKQSIRWYFNPPAAPHMGGSWERMVKSVKVALGDTLSRKNLHEEVLNTLLIEAEHTVNSHPLTHVPDDPNDPEALTPNHFLIGKSSNLQPNGEFCENDLFGRKQWRITQTLAEHFWKRWVKEYLPTLLRREKWCQNTKPIAVGDVVLEVNNNYPRSTWPKGRVKNVFPGKDGLVRVVDIVLANGHVYRRPVAKLCVLDVNAAYKPAEIGTAQEEDPTKNNPTQEDDTKKNATPEVNV
jgi:hypothetical protein